MASSSAAWRLSPARRRCWLFVANAEVGIGVALIQFIQNDQNALSGVHSKWSVRRMNARTVMIAGTTGLCCQRPTRWVEEKYASWGLKPLGAWIATRKIARCCEAVPSHTFQVFLFPMLQTAAGGSSARRHQKAPTIQSVACGGHPRQASLHVAPGTKTFWPDGRGVVRLRL